MKKIIIGLFTIFTANIFSQTYTPISVTGFNVDGVAETYPNALSSTSQALDLVSPSNSVMYTAAFGVSAGFGGGLPNSGTIVNGTKTYQLMPYNGNNTLFTPSGNVGILTLTTPAKFSNINLLVFSTEGASTINVTLNYTDLTTTNAGNFSVLDWFNGAGAMLSGFGRCKRVASGTTSSGLTTNPRFYPINISLSCANQQKYISSIKITGVSSNVAGGGPYVMAVSGASATAVTPTVAYVSSTLCQASAVVTPTITGTSGGTFSVSPSGLSINSSSGSINLGLSAVNNYTVTYYTTGACPFSTSYSLSVGNTPTISVSNATICNGDSALLTASTGANSYLWNTGATTPTIYVSPNSTTIYTVVGTTNGCSDTKTLSVNVDPGPVLTLTPSDTTICIGQSVQLGVSGATTYTWLPNNTNPINTVSPTISTVYSVSGTSNGCSSTKTVSVNVDAIPVLTLTPSNAVICIGDSVQLNVSGATNYTWQPSGSGTSTTVTPLSSTVYTVIGNAGVCTSIPQMVSVIVNPIPSVTIIPSPTIICTGQSSSLSTTTSIFGGTYTWFPNNQTNPSITESPLSNTSYTVVYSVNGCTTSAVSSISVNITPSVTVNSESICFGQSATLTATPSISGGLYSWTPLGQTTSSISDSPTNTSLYNVTYSLNGCSSTSTATITAIPVPPLLLLPSANPILPLESVTIVATSSVVGGSYVWNNGNTSQMISANPQNTATYCATLTTVQGCTNTACVDIVVNEESTLYIPNVFTPNGDGVNDIFYTLGTNISSFKLQIFNRWGSLIFSSDSITRGWDGKVGGDLVSNGVYVYVINAIGTDNVEHNKKGHITVFN